MVSSYFISRIQSQDAIKILCLSDHSLNLYLGKVIEGKADKFDTTFVMLDDDLLDLFSGKLNPQNAFMQVSCRLKLIYSQGKMKIKGNMAKAMKFTPDIIPKDAKL